MLVRQWGRGPKVQVGAWKGKSVGRVMEKSQGRFKSQDGQTGYDNISWPEILFEFVNMYIQIQQL